MEACSQVYTLSCFKIVWEWACEFGFAFTFLLGVIHRWDHVGILETENLRGLTYSNTYESRWRPLGVV